MTYPNIHLSELTQGDPQQAFSDALATGALSKNTSSEIYVGLALYQGTHPTEGHVFKHKRSGIYWFSPPKTKGQAMLHLVAARERQDDAVKSLQEALKVSGAVASVAILPLIQRASVLRNDIAALVGAFEADAKDEFERSTVPS